MAVSLGEHMYPTRDDIGHTTAPLVVTQFENLHNLVNQLFLKADGDQTKPPTLTNRTTFRQYRATGRRHF
jgi:hypothetical protein